MKKKRSEYLLLGIGILFIFGIIFSKIPISNLDKNGKGEQIPKEEGKSIQIFLINTQPVSPEERLEFKIENQSIFLYTTSLSVMGLEKYSDDEWIQVPISDKNFTSNADAMILKGLETIHMHLPLNVYMISPGKYRCTFKFYGNRYIETYEAYFEVGSDN